MGKTSIEWTDTSWNPIVGCTEVSPGCANCYNQQRWTGDVRFLPDRLDEPLHWKKPQRIFVCDMGDLFHESVSAGLLFEIFEVIRACPQHTFQILTKRADRMRLWIKERLIHQQEDDRTGRTRGFVWPLPNVWVGVSVENQHFAEERIPALLATPAAVRWISAEPLLGQVNLGTFIHPPWNAYKTGLDWVVAGGESGPNARPMHPNWARSLRDQCQAAGVPFFFKQWGEWIMGDTVTSAGISLKVGKKRAGRLLDGREWNEFPKGKHHGCTD